MTAAPVRILVVDDHPENLYLLRALLEGHGFAVEEARHGVDALQKARRQPPALVISDLLMPVLDGYGLLRQWRADESLRTIPFIVYTATFTEPRDERLAMALGADAFFVKPTEPELLLARVRAVLAEAAAGTLRSARDLPVEEHRLLREYNEVLVSKLEQKARALEEANRVLREEVSARAESQAEASRSGQLLQAVVEGTADAVFAKSADGRYLLANAGCALAMGRPTAEILGRPDAELLPESEARTLRANDELVMRTGRAHTMEEPITMEGTTRIFLAHKAPLRDAQGAVVGIIGISRDITERRALEEQLRQSQKMDAVGRLAGGVAHDFNNLLTVINGYSEELLGDPTLGADHRTSVQSVHEAGQKAATLTRQLLSFSRQAMLQPRVVDVNAHVSRTAGLLRRLIGEDVHFTTVLDQHCHPVRVDPGQLDQVLMNLAVNARDAMPQGGTLTLETRNVELTAEYCGLHIDCKPGDYVQLTMSDSGVGMTPEVLANIFEPFFTTKALGEGTGLGLAMVFGIVQQSGGAVHAYSEPGIGSTFRIYLPAAAPEPRRSDPVSAEALRGDETVLVVEDDEAVRTLTVRALQASGYRVLAARDGVEAQRVAQSHEGALDLVLTDVVMPNIGGPALAAQLRTERPALKVLFMSGYTDDAVVRHGLLQASMAFIQKPYSIRALGKKVRAVLDGDSA
jgi:two-component system cell cycle sensor histidine kinase/response regulator CckA